MRERIAFLEKELIEAKLQVAFAKSNEERLILEVLQMKTMISELTGDESGNEFVRVVVPMSDPFGRKNTARRRLSHKSSDSGLNLLGLANCDSYDSLGISSTGSRKKRVLNPGSCSSGLNLLSSLSNRGSMMSLSSSSFDRSIRRRSNDNTDKKNEEWSVMTD